MKFRRSSLFFSRTAPSFLKYWFLRPEREPAFPLLTVRAGFLIFFHHVYSLAVENDALTTRAVNYTDARIRVVFLSTPQEPIQKPHKQTKKRRKKKKARFQMHHKSFNKAYVEIEKQIIKGTHEKGKYCTVHSRGVARKRNCWVSQWAIHRL